MPKWRNISPLHLATLTTTQGDSMRGSDAFQEDAQHHLAAGDVPAYMQALGQGARAAASALRRANTHIKNQALEAMAQRVAAARGAGRATNALMKAAET